jgi:uncharacterized protein with HEPN domain
MPLSPLEYLRHIQDEAEFFAARMKGLRKERFMQDETVKRAFVRSIEIIGEAARECHLTSGNATLKLNGEPSQA